MEVVRGRIEVEAESAALLSLPNRVVRRVAPRQFEEHYARKYAQPLRKLSFFVRREGLVGSLRKARSKRLERSLEAEQSIVVAALGRVEGAWGVTRDLGGPLRFHRALLFEGSGEAEDGGPSLDDRALARLEAFLPVPACPAAEEAALAILACNPELRPMTAESVLELGAGDRGPSIVSEARNAPAVHRDNAPGVYLAGFGGYVREQVLPWFEGDVRAAADYKAELIARHVRPSFALFDEAQPMLARIASDPRPLVIISAYHSDHASLALQTLDANPRACVFIEKPAAVGAGEAVALATRRRAGAWLDVGYNRRYAPLLKRLRSEAEQVAKPWLLTMSVNELKLPSSHWYRWPNQGTRITGNGCHWIDLAVHLIASTPQELTLLSSRDTVIVAIAFADGSLANISLGDAGDDLRGVQEWVELRGGSTTIVLDDFRRLSISASNGTRGRTVRHRDKGHARMYRDLRRRWLGEGGPAYPVEDLEVVCDLTARASALLLGREPGTGRPDVATGGDGAGDGSR